MRHRDDGDLVLLNPLVSLMDRGVKRCVGRMHRPVVAGVVGDAARPGPCRRSSQERIGAEQGWGDEAVFIGRVEPGDLQPDPEEVADFRFVTPEELEVEIGDGERYTPWFQLAWPVVRDAAAELP